MSWLTTNIISRFLLPPLSFLLLGIAGVMLANKRPRLGRGLIVLMLALLWIFSLPVTANFLLGKLEENSLLQPDKTADAQAMVVLAGGSYCDAPEYGGMTANHFSLERIRYAAILHRQTQLPLLVTGGDPEKHGLSEAELMKKALEQEFNIPVRWIETKSANTIQNASYSRKVIGNDIRTILLVTHSWHIPRARRLFERAGFEVIAAGTGFHSLDHLTTIDFLPSAKALLNSSLFFHETIGMLRDTLVMLPSSGLPQPQRVQYHDQ